MYNTVENTSVWRTCIVHVLLHTTLLFESSVHA